MSAIDPSQYEKILLESSDKEKVIDIKMGCIAIEYFEDIFSPTITVKIQFVNTGGQIKGPDGYMDSVYNGLPLRGGERVSLKIGGNTESNPGLDFHTEESDYFYVSNITNVIRTKKQESFVIHLCSKEAITNETARIGKKYIAQNISESVGKIFNYLKSDKNIDIEKTSGKYGFISNMRKPFTLLTWLASKSVPASGPDGSTTAGYCFYETKSGYKFKSIDGLIGEEHFPKDYTFSEISQAQMDDYKILDYTITENQDLLTKLKRGAFCSTRMFFDPLKHTYAPQGEKAIFKMKDYQGKLNPFLLGDDLHELPKINDTDEDSLGDLPTRQITAILDIGTLDEKVTRAENANPMEVQSQSLMRYNLLMTQTVNMLIPSNTQLEAGNIIKCVFPTINRTISKGGEIDQQQSGRYMIKSLCHHFTSAGSFTSLDLVKDTSGGGEVGEPGELK
tara:strand:+ start:5801 stop:7147 length:1347 start_codon:yes stop_codon:yes gene_type:complete